MEKYTHQLGGHCTILKLPNKPLIFKPFCANEAAFYEYVWRAPESSPFSGLKEFLPSWFGNKSILVEQDNYSHSLSDGSSPSTSGSKDDCAKSEGNSSSRSFAASQYLVLKDLLHGSRKPCMLDIKVGKVQRTINASPEKRRRQLDKSATTTSCDLNFRLCGSLRYDRRNGTLVYRDKYWGRKLTKEGVVRALRAWLSNEKRVDIPLIDVIYSRLDKLSKVIEKLPHIRFWSSSMLWYFDGYPKDPKERSAVRRSGQQEDRTIVLSKGETPDEELLSAIYNLKGILMALKNECLLSGLPGWNRLPKSLLQTEELQIGTVATAASVISGESQPPLYLLDGWEEEEVDGELHASLTRDKQSNSTTEHSSNNHQDINPIKHGCCELFESTKNVLSHSSRGGGGGALKLHLYYPPSVRCRFRKPLAETIALRRLKKSVPNIMPKYYAVSATGRRNKSSPTQQHQSQTEPHDLLLSAISAYQEEQLRKEFIQFQSFAHSTSSSPAAAAGGIR